MFSILLLEKVEDIFVVDQSNDSLHLYFILSFFSLIFYIFLYLLTIYVFPLLMSQTPCVIFLINCMFLCLLLFFIKKEMPFAEKGVHDINNNGSALL